MISLHRGHVVKDLKLTMSSNTLLTLGSKTLLTMGSNFDLASRMCFRGSVVDDDDDDDDEVGSTFRRSARAKSKRVRGARSRVVDDDDDDGDDDGDEMAGAMRPSSGNKDDAGARVMAADSDDDDGDGVVLVNDSPHPGHPESSAVLGKPALHAVASPSDEDGEDDAEIEYDSDDAAGGGAAMVISEEVCFYDAVESDRVPLLYHASMLLLDLQ